MKKHISKTTNQKIVRKNLLIKFFLRYYYYYYCKRQSSTTKKFVTRKSHAIVSEIQSFQLIQYENIKTISYVFLITTASSDILIKPVPCYFYFSNIIRAIKFLCLGRKKNFFLTSGHQPTISRELISGFRCRAPTR